MLRELFEPYHKDKDAWDWKIISLVSVLFAARSLDAMIVAILICLFCGVVLFLGFISYCIVCHIAYIYRTYGQGNTRNARILQTVGIGLLLSWATSYVFHNADAISRGTHLNIISWTFLVFSITLWWIEKREKAKTPPVLPNTGRSKLTTYLNWNTKNKQP